MDVLTGDGVLRIFEIRDASGTTMPARQIVRSLKDTLGLTKSDLLKSLEELSNTVERLKASRTDAGPISADLVRKTS